MNTNRVVQGSSEQSTVNILQSRLRISVVVNIVLVAVIVFLLIVIFALNPSSEGTATNDKADSQATSSETAGSESASDEQSEETVVRNDPNDQLAIGDINAPVILSEWTDYRCPFCAVFANETLPTLIDEYVESGQLRIEFNDVYFFGDDSYTAAIAARAAAEQGYYLQYIEALYAAAPESGHPDLPRETLIGFAETAGVPDMDKFEADLDSEELAAAVEQSNAQAVAWGISSVPFFVVGNQAVSGAQPIDTFRSLIDSQLD